MGRERGGSQVLALQTVAAACEAVLDGKEGGE